MKEQYFKLATYQFAKAFNKLDRDSEGLKLLCSEILPEYLVKCRWFASKSSKIESISIEAIVPIEYQNSCSWLCLLSIHYEFGKNEQYSICLGFYEGYQEPDHRKAKICQASFNDIDGFLVDAIYLEEFREALIHHFTQASKIDTAEGTLMFEKGNSAGFSENVLDSSVLDADQSNSAIIYGDRYFMKFFRKLFYGENPDLEMVRFITQTDKFHNIPGFVASISFKPVHKPIITIAMCQKKVEATMDVWTLYRSFIHDYKSKLDEGNFEFSDEWDHSPFELINRIIDEQEVAETIGEKAITFTKLLGRRTAEMHVALFSKKEEPAFAPETFDTTYRKFILNKLDHLLLSRVNLLNANFELLTEDSRLLAEYFLRKTDEIASSFKKLCSKKYTSYRIRVHGDYHLGQVLYDGVSDLTILDFEGEPESSIEDRRIKHSPLKDVAGMMRSFHYAIYAHLFFGERNGMDLNYLELSAENWYRQIAGIYLSEYIQTMEANQIALGTKKDIISLIELHLLEKAVYEFGYELNGRPDWVIIPLKGIQQVLENI
jgi:maltose alpha-D-glucosyltransferase/alpha-amylase